VIEFGEEDAFFGTKQRLIEIGEKRWDLPSFFFLAQISVWLQIVKRAARMYCQTAKDGKKECGFGFLQSGFAELLSL